MVRITRGELLLHFVGLQNKLFIKTYTVVGLVLAYKIAGYELL